MLAWLVGARSVGVLWLRWWLRWWLVRVVVALVVGILDRSALIDDRGHKPQTAGHKPQTTNTNAKAKATTHVTYSRATRNIPLVSIVDLYLRPSRLLIGRN